MVCTKLILINLIAVAPQLIKPRVLIGFLFLELSVIVYAITK